MLAKNDLYRIRIFSNAKNNSSLFVQAAIPACELQKSHFKEEIVLHLSADDNVVGLVYSSPTPATISRACDPSKVPATVKFLTKAKVAERLVSQAVPLQALGPRPPVLNGVNIGAADSNAEAKPAKQTILGQYWYIILPLAFLVFFGGGEEPAKKGATPTAASSAAAAT